MSPTPITSHPDASLWLELLPYHSYSCTDSDGMVGGETVTRRRPTSPAIIKRCHPRRLNPASVPYFYDVQVPVPGFGASDTNAAHSRTHGHLGCVPELAGGRSPSPSSSCLGAQKLCGGFRPAVRSCVYRLPGSHSGTLCGQADDICRMYCTVLEITGRTGAVHICYSDRPPAAGWGSSKTSHRAHITQFNVWHYIW